jgi:hypothetical protein
MRAKSGAPNQVYLLTFAGLLWLPSANLKRLYEGVHTLSCCVHSKIW